MIPFPTSSSGRPRQDEASRAQTLNDLAAGGSFSHDLRGFVPWNRLPQQVAAGSFLGVLPRKCGRLAEVGRPFGVKFAGGDFGPCPGKPGVPEGLHRLARCHPASRCSIGRRVARATGPPPALDRNATNCTRVHLYGWPTRRLASCVDGPMTLHRASPNFFEASKGGTRT